MRTEVGCSPTLRWVRHIVLVLTFLLLCLSLSGCGQVYYHVTINKDGSADLEYRVGISDSLLGLAELGDSPIDKMRKSAEAEGFAVKNYREGGMTGIIATKHFASMNELSAKFQELLEKGIEEGMSLKDQIPNVEVKKVFWQTHYTFKADIDLSLNKTAEGDPIADVIANTFLNQMDLRFLLTLPVTPKTHNALRVSDDGKTLEWQLIPNSLNRIQVEVIVPNLVNIGVTLAGAVVLILVGVYIGFIRPRRMAARQAN